MSILNFVETHICVSDIGVKSINRLNPNFMIPNIHKKKVSLYLRLKHAVLFTITLEY